jgi:hypothetical protein
LEANYIAAGYDPDGFWRLTLRQYVQRMDAAGRRLRAASVMMARSVWVGTHLSGRDLENWCAETLGTSIDLPEEMLGMVLAQQTAGMTVISRAEALRRMTNGIAE